MTTASFKVRSWDEKPVSEFAEGTKTVVAHVGQAYSGGIEGESIVDYVMFYGSDGVATVSGIEHLTVTVNGKAGTFAIRHSGRYTAEEGASSDWSVIPNSGTGALKGIGGSGSYHAGHEGGQVEF